MRPEMLLHTWDRWDTRSCYLSLSLNTYRQEAQWKWDTMAICYIYCLSVSENLVQCDTEHTVQNIWLKYRPETFLFIGLLGVLQPLLSLLCCSYTALSTWDNSLKQAWSCSQTFGYKEHSHRDVAYKCFQDYFFVYRYKSPKIISEKTVWLWYF